MLRIPDVRCEPLEEASSRAWQILATPEQLERWAAMTAPYVLEPDHNGRLVRRPLAGWRPVVVRQPAPGNN
jgi:hypothetical protein